MMRCIKMKNPYFNCCLPRTRCHVLGCVILFNLLCRWRQQSHIRRSLDLVVVAGIVVLEGVAVLVGAPMEVVLVDHLVAWIMFEGSITILPLLVAPVVEANSVSVLGLSMGVASFRA